MVKTQNKELARAEYACRTMRNTIKIKDRELEDLYDSITKLRSETNDWRRWFQNSVVVSSAMIITSVGLCAYATMSC